MSHLRYLLSLRNVLMVNDLSVKYTLNLYKNWTNSYFDGIVIVDQYGIPVLKPSVLIDSNQVCKKLSPLVFNKLLDLDKYILNPEKN